MHAGRGQVNYLDSSLGVSGPRGTPSGRAECFIDAFHLFKEKVDQKKVTGRK